MKYLYKTPWSSHWAPHETDSLTRSVNRGFLERNWHIKQEGDPHVTTVDRMLKEQMLRETTDESKSCQPPANALCYVLVDGQQTGPYTPDQIQSMWTAGQITADTLYWFEGLKNWFPVKGFCQSPKRQTNEIADKIEESTIVCSYFLAFLLPFFGFFAGIYLVLKKQSGHGVACIALSVLMFLVFFLMLHL